MFIVDIPHTSQSQPQQALPPPSPPKPHHHHHHMGQEEADEEEQEEDHTMPVPLSAQRVQQEYLRLKRTWRLRATEGESYYDIGSWLLICICHVVCGVHL